MQAFHYSIIRAVPNVDRDEAVNIGLVVIADDGSFADARFADVRRVRLLAPNATTTSFALFARTVRSALPAHGRQPLLEAAREPLTIDRLSQWSGEFGGIVRVSNPRVMLATEGSALADRLFLELVAPPTPIRAKEVPDRPVTRRRLISELEQELSAWNVSDELIGRDHHVRGARADHLIDRIFHHPNRSVAAIVHAISFQTELADTYAARASLIVATEDLRERNAEVGSYALYADGVADRVEVVRESARLFESRRITAVDYRDLKPLRADLAALLLR